MYPTLTFLGAAGTVTGSKFLLDSGRARVLVDCGLFQGDRSWREQNWEPLPIDPASVDAVVVTHAHLDHCGYLPVLVKDGFTGPVVCTPETAALLPIVLRDAAHLQEQEAQWSRSSGVSRHREPRPLFDTGDAEKALALLTPVPRHVQRVLAEDIAVTLRRAGHILGSAFAEVSIGDLRVVFSGDLGRLDHPLLLPPEDPPPADIFVVESTYGDRRHDDHGLDELAKVLTRTLRRGGTALLPAFAVDRTPMLLHEIRTLVSAGRVPDVPVYVDSPMALAALKVYQDALATPAGDFRPDLGHAEAFDPGRLRLVPSAAESARLNDPRHPCIVVSASGMAAGGRVVHHLERQLPNQRNTVVLTGYQVAGTRGRALADGARQIKIRGRYVPVRAEVANIRGFSAHADAEQLVGWLGRSGHASGSTPEMTFVVHGEPHSSAALAEQVRTTLAWPAVVPSYQERVRLR